MDKKNWQKAKKLFHEAVELSANEREKFLAENCQDENICREVEELLAFHENDSNFINESAAVESGFVTGKTDFIGKKIGRYEILREIGRGGMGVVYEAVRHDDFEQKVALKIIKRGMDTDFILRRFQNERQILASLNHPNIAQLLDGGTTDDGLPYLAMEYIQGEPLIKFCNANKFNIEERLNLFLQVCSAVSFAHQNLIIHRDLKPSNILVSADRSPKLLDFGIAKIINPTLEFGETTDSFARLFTPEYASPEQIRGGHITTTSDVYSLGVVLYELLSGKHPYRRKKNLAPHEWMKEICETEPTAPSRAWQDAETRRHKDAADTRGDKTNLQSPFNNLHSLRGDLDKIVLKALQKEPSRRYSSVEQFAEDIRRHLKGLPVIAQTDSVSYRASKFIKRHRFGVFATGLIFLSLLGGISATAWEAYRANTERTKAEKRFNQVHKLANAVLFEYHDGIAKLAGSTAIREKMVKDALEYLDNLSAESGADTALKLELAKAYVKVGDVQGNPYYSNLGNIDGAIESYQKAYAIREELFQSNPADAEIKFELAGIYNALGDIFWAKGNNEESLADYQKAVQIFEELASNDLQNLRYQTGIAYALNGIGHVQTQLSDYKSALEAYEKALKINENVLGSDPNNKTFQESAAGSYLKLGDSQMDNEDLQNALANFGKCENILIGLSMEDQNNERVLRKLALTDGRLANVYSRLRHFEKAIEFNRKALAQQEKIMRIDPDDSQIQSDIATTYNSLADDFSNLKQFESAEESVKNAIKEFENVLKKNPDFLQIRGHNGDAYQTLAEILTKKGEYQKAIETYRKSIEILEDEKIKKSELIYLIYDYDELGDLYIFLANKEKIKQSEHSKEAKSLYQKCLAALNELPDSNMEKADLNKKVSEKLSKIKE